MSLLDRLLSPNWQNLIRSLSGFSKQLGLVLFCSVGSKNHVIRPDDSPLFPLPVGPTSTVWERLGKKAAFWTRDANHGDRIPTELVAVEGASGLHQTGGVGKFPAGMRADHTQKTGRSISFLLRFFFFPRREKSLKQQFL